MESKTIKVTLISIIIGLYFMFHLPYFSGMNPIIDLVIKIIILALFISSIILIFKESNRKLKSIQCIILIAGIGIGIFVAGLISNYRIEKPIRTYINDKVE